MNVFLKPIFAELVDLECNGVVVKSSSFPNPFISKVIVLARTYDFPVKCLVLNTIQFNECLGAGITFHQSWVQIHSIVFKHKYKYCKFSKYKYNCKYFG